MTLIADGGSTKCDAILLDENLKEKVRFSLQGFNPRFYTEKKIAETLAKSQEIQLYKSDVKRIFYYGAACSSSELNAIVENGFRPLFPTAQISIDHDLKSAALATFDGNPAITCILGTGSNSVFFDGKDLREERPALGFILGDEGSASHIGKKLVRAFLYQQMPKGLSQKFIEKYALEKEEILRRVNSEPHANVFLASLAPFASENIAKFFIENLVKTSFEEFLKIHVLPFENAEKLPIHFVGSVAFYFKESLKESLQNLHLKMGKIVQKPLDGLVDYHRKYIL